MSNGLMTTPLCELFNLDPNAVFANPGIQHFPPSDNPYIPQKNDDYVFRLDELRDLITFLNNPCGDALWISGPTGSGKTSLVTEAAARLNYPVMSITMNGRMEFSELRGMFTVVSKKPGEQPQTVFKHGPLACAMKYGFILLINEIDLADPAELSGLNDILEGRPLVIAENGGEIIKPHPNFRVIVTANSNGAGDSTGLYQGIQTQNIAAMDRYRFMEVNYPSPEVEKAILMKAGADRINPDLVDRMIELANEIRRCFVGDAEGSGKLSLTLSTRTLVRWCQLASVFHNRANANPMLYAFERAFLMRALPEERKAILDMCCAIFGAEWMELSAKINKPKAN